MEKIKIKNIEDEYKNWIQKKFGPKKTFTADEIINISLELFYEYKIKGIKNEEDSDMLLFQYGTYDWGNGKYFSFDITRQFIIPRQDEPYQLALVLSFEPIDCKSYHCWNIDFESLEKWVENIKGTEGYKIAKQLECRKYELTFEQC